MNDLPAYPKPSQLEGRKTLTAAQRRKQLDAAVERQRGRCKYCGCLLTREPERMNTAVREHVKPGKMGGCKDDSDSNIVAACWLCNTKKGSQRNWKHK